MPHGQRDMRCNKSEDDITAEVLVRFGETPDPRQRQIMPNLIGHLCDLVRHDAPTPKASRLRLSSPLLGAAFDFRLAPAGAARVTTKDAQRRLAALGARA
jgi:hypothetical protein